jgi:EAL domain-containing protein (putative c-di-GMP-specific phosphodiesterase class I)
VGHELVLAVNSTVADLLDDTFPHEIVAALDARGLAHHALVIEVTESSILSNPERIERVLTQLKELGVGISLDDFGTGYASLTHLKSLPVRELKLDRSFVAQMCTDSTDAAIVSATVELAHRLGIRVVAEGVEDELTWRTLHELGCERIQGYLLSRPIAAAELTQLLRSRASPVGEPASAPIPA